MHTAIAHLKSSGPYGQSRYIETPKKDRELADDYEKRTWKDRIHADSKGMVFIPPTALKKTVEEAAKFLSIQIPGKGKATWTKHFLAGIMVTDPLLLGIKKDDVPGEWLHLDANGKKDSGTRFHLATVEAWLLEHFQRGGVVPAADPRRKAKAGAAGAAG